MALLLQSWLVLTAGLSLALAVVIGVQALVRLVRRPAPAADVAAQPETTSAATRSGLVVQVPAPRRAQAQDLVPTQ